MCTLIQSVLRWLKKHPIITGVIFTCIAILVFARIFGISLSGISDFRQNTKSSNCVSSGEVIRWFGATCVSIAGAIFVVVTLMNQNYQNEKLHIETTFFKYIETYYETTKQIQIQRPAGTVLKGLSAFVFMRTQLQELLCLVKDFNEKAVDKTPDDSLIDYAYMKFMYGAECDFSLPKCMTVENKQRLNEKVRALSKISNVYIGEAYHSVLGSYMRNIYRAFKFIDSSLRLSSDEKKEYIKILRAQLSNPELYLFYYSIRARWGKKWLEKDYLRTYQLLNAMPDEYCKEFDHKVRFPVLGGYSYEADEVMERKYPVIQKYDTHISCEQKCCVWRKLLEEASNAVGAGGV